MRLAMYIQMLNKLSISVVRCFLLSGALILVSRSGLAAEQWKAELNLQTLAFDNLFLDQSKQSDVAVRPSWELGANFGEYWSVGYRGEYNHYFETTTLQSHFHEIYLFLNPVWGEEGENELVAELTLETLRNRDDYQVINYLSPTLYLKARMELSRWFAWQAGVKALYKRFYDDQSSSSPDAVDAWLDAYCTFTLPSWTTISPKIAFGQRFYAHEQSTDSITQDDQDQSLEMGVHLSQGLWPTAGLQVDYAYILALGDSGVLARKLTAEQFAYLGQEFLYSGHRASLGFKQLVGFVGMLTLFVNYETKDYAGWPLLDDTGALTGKERVDHRLIPGLSYDHEFYPDSESALVPRAGFTVDYRYIHQLSNHVWYQANSHMGGVSLRVTW